MTKTTTAKSNSPRAHSPGTETAAQILGRERDLLIHEWLALVEKQEDLMTIQLSYEDRTGHLPQLLSDVIARLHLDSSTKAPISVAASHHEAICGANRATRWPWWWKSRDCCKFAFSPLCTSTPSNWIT
jgi:hypothetical protein